MKKYDDMVVIFLDILGTQETEDFHKMFTIHETFHSEIMQHQRRQDSLPHVKYTRESRSFSDCTYIFYKLKDQVKRSEDHLLHLLFTSLYNSSISILQFYNKGFLIRGGAAVGNAYLDELGFFGPAINTAYSLESKVAKYPRILISKDIGEKLYELEKKGIDEADPNIINLINPHKVQLIQIDQDGEYFLNVFYQLQLTGSIRSASGILEFDKIRDVLMARIHSDLEEKADNEKIVEKLIWMKNYLSNLKINTNSSQFFTSLNS